MRAGLMIALAILAMGTHAALAEGDSAAGAKVLNRCKACHAADKPMNKVGPHLVGIVGRPVASVANFNYSKAMKAKGAEGAVWDEATLTQYLTDPKAFMPGNAMAFPGMKKPQDIADLIAYLKSMPAP